jgi:hypothetical protein
MRKPYRAIVCGGRKYDDYLHVQLVLDRLKEALDDGHGKYLVIIEGGDDGADDLAHSWCISHSVVCETYSANWALYGKKAGPIRNEQMIEHGADLVIAFPGGKGTQDMVRRAEAEGVKVVLA